MKNPETGEEEWHEGECRILQEDLDNAKQFAREVMQEKNLDIRRQWEHDFYASVKEQYSAQVAGALLMKVWDWTKQDAEEEDEEHYSDKTWGTEELSVIARKMKDKLLGELQ